VEAEGREASQGRWFETSRSASADDLLGVVGALEAKNAPPVELVAAFVAGIDLAHLGPGRVHLPVAVPGGARGSWNCGRNAIREALFRERVPRSARWVATDGWTGRAVAWGATRDAAMEAWRAEVARTRPFPEKPKPPTEPLPQAPLQKIEPENPFGPKPNGRNGARSLLRGRQMVPGYVAGADQSFRRIPIQGSSEWRRTCCQGGPP
jgi:hypothetical protein